MSKFLDMDGLQYYTNKFKPGLANVIDNGEKNVVDLPTVTTAGSQFIFQQYTINFPLGSYMFSYNSTQEQSGDLEIIIYDNEDVSSANIIFRKTIVSKNGINTVDFTIDADAKLITMYSVRAGIYSQFMICTLQDWNISQEYQPYHKNIATNNDIIQMWENS